MNISREVITDLLPTYLAGDASPATCALVEEYLKNDPELAQRVLLLTRANLRKLAPSSMSPEREISALIRTRRFLAWQRCLFGLALFFTAIGLSLEFSTRNGHIQEIHLLLRDHPLPFGVALVCAVVCWLVFLAVRRRIYRAGF